MPKIPDIKIPDINTDVSKAAKDIAAVAKDATYVVIGAGVLGIQRAQVQRQELQKKLAEPRTDLGQRVASVRSDLGEALQAVDVAVDTAATRVEELIERMEMAVAPLEDYLPAQARRRGSAGPRPGQRGTEPDPLADPDSSRLIPNRFTGARPAPGLNSLQRSSAEPGGPGRRAGWPRSASRVASEGEPGGLGGGEARAAPEASRVALEASRVAGQGPLLFFASARFTAYSR